MSNRSILVVEDEIELINTWENMLNYFGYTPILAHNALEAIEQLQTHQVHVIITDITTPVRGGKYLLDYLQMKGMNTPTIVCTGHLSAPDLLDEYQVEKVIQKPFNMLAEIQELDQYF